MVPGLALTLRDHPEHALRLLAPNVSDFGNVPGGLDSNYERHRHKLLKELDDNVQWEVVENTGQAWFDNQSTYYRFEAGDVFPECTALALDRRTLGQWLNCVEAGSLGWKDPATPLISRKNYEDACVPVCTGYAIVDSKGYLADLICGDPNPKGVQLPGRFSGNSRLAYYRVADQKLGGYTREQVVGPADTYVQVSHGKAPGAGVVNARDWADHLLGRIYVPDSVQV